MNGNNIASVLETAQSLVRIPSVNPAYDPESPGEVHVVEWLQAWAAKHDFACTTEEIFPGRCNVIFQLRNGADRPHLLLNGHTDTVSVAAMTIPPFEAECRDGRLWGRGAADMKGPLACMLHTLLHLREDRAGWKGTVTLACVVDEEATFRGIQHSMAGNPMYDFAIVGEPTRFTVIRGCKGCLRFFIRCHGVAAHSSTPAKGASAIGAMAQAIQALEEFFNGELASVRHPDFGSSTGSIGLIHGGSGINIVPDFCEVKVDIRLVPGQSWKETYARVRQVAGIKLPGIRWEFDPDPLVDIPFCLEDGHPFVEATVQAGGGKPAEVVHFSCDASKIAAAGIPCIIFGPGDIAQAHTANESIAIEDLEAGVNSYLQIAQALLRP